MKKRKVNRKKFISRISIVILFFVIIFLFVNGIFKTDNVTNNDLSLIIDTEDVTSRLKQDMYIDKNGVLYLSTDDIKNLFDNHLFYEEGSNKIITTYGTKVAAIEIESNTMELNSASILLTSGIIKTDTGILLPISEMKSIYNIDVKTNGKSALVFSLYNSLTTISTTKKVSLKTSESIFSKTIQKIPDGQELIYIENSEKSGWIKVLTYEGNIGYLKEKELGEITQVRTDMKESDFSSKEVDSNDSIEINYKTLTQEGLVDFSSRKNVVQDIISKILSKEKFTVNINLEKVEVSKDKIERLIIELIPRLKEIGANVMISNNSILNDEFLKEFNL